MINRKELKTAAKLQLKGNIWPFIGAHFIVFLATYALNKIPNVGFIGTLFLAWMSVGLCGMYLGLHKGRNPKLKDLFSRIDIFLCAALCALGVSVATLPAIILWGISAFVVYTNPTLALLLGIAGTIWLVYISLLFAFLEFILAETPSITATQALKLSVNMIKGYKNELLILMFSFTGWFVLMIITLGIASFYVLPYVNATLANFYCVVKGEYEKNNGLNPVQDDAPFLAE